MDDEIVSPELRQTDPTLDLKALPTGVSNEISSTALIDGGPSGTVSYDRELAKQVLRDAGGDLNKAAEALLARGFDMDGVLAFGEIALKDQDLIDDPDVGSYIAPPPALVPVPPMGGVDEFGNPVAPPPVYDSRFDNEQDAIQYAEENGQGDLTSGADGELYNRFGEKMVYDSSGNLAPAPRDIPVGMIPDPNNPNGFVDSPNWVDPGYIPPPIDPGYIPPPIDPGYIPPPIDPGYIPPPVEQIEYIPPPESPTDFYL
jgi:hypothetical protein